MLDYLMTLTSLIVVGVILATSLSLVQGFAGIVTVSHGALMGVGAYVVAVLNTQYGVDAGVAVMLGAIGAGLVAWLFMTVAARLDEDDFILASFAMQMVVVDLFTQWTAVTNGSYGIFGITRPTLLGVRLDALPLFTAFAVLLGIISWAVLAYISRSGYGLILRGMRESSRSLEAVGKDVFHTKVVTFAVGGAFAGLAGGVFATSISLITPEDFGIDRSILVVAFLLVGGMGSMTGAVLGAISLLALPEVVKHIAQVPPQWLGPGQQIVYGVIIVLFVSLRPQGIIRERPVLRFRRGAGRVARFRGPSKGGAQRAAGD